MSHFSNTLNKIKYWNMFIQNLLYHVPELPFSSFSIHLRLIMTVKSVLTLNGLRSIVTASVQDKAALVSLHCSPPAAPCSGFCLLCLQLPRQSGVNEDICFHSGSAGTGPTLPHFAETISRHLLAADCSGRSVLLLSPFTAPSGLGKVLHRSASLCGTPVSEERVRTEEQTQRKKVQATELWIYMNI